MKTKILLSILGLILILTSCKKENAPPLPPQKDFDMEAKIKVPIDPSANSIQSFTDSAQRSKFIFEYGFDIISTDCFDEEYSPGTGVFPGSILGLVMDSYHLFRDTVNLKYVFGGYFVVTNTYGGLCVGSFPLAQDMILRAAIDSNGQYIHPKTWYFEHIARYDTIAYIPNAVLADSKIVAKKAFADKDWETLYGLFDTHFKFIPITGKEYLELAAQGLH